VGTGFSYSDYSEDYYNWTEEEIMEEVYTFLQMFFTKYPQYSTQQFFLFGESYAGHYIPVLSSIIIKANKVDILMS
jgi:carboxypeptidase C (cathepsin A)